MASPAALALLEQLKRGPEPKPTPTPTTGKQPKPAEPTPAEVVGLKSSTLAFKRRVTKRHLLNDAGINRAIDQLVTLPEPGECIHAIMGGDYHGLDIIPAIRTMRTTRIDRLFIATLSFSKRNVLQLAGMFDNEWIGETGIVVSQYFAKADAEIYTGAVAEFAKRGIRLVHTRNHAKVMLLQAGSDYYVVEGSANLRSCMNLEQFALSNDKELFEFHERWITHLLDNPSA